MDRVEHSLRWLLTALVAATAPAACGGNVTETPLGTGGGTTSSGTGGAGGTGGDGGAAVCGGQAGVACDPDEYCEFDPAGSCGGLDGAGTCAPRPDGCPPDCPGVCGCDGVSYCNECGAHAAGVDVDESASCTQPDATYSAWNLFAHVPRFVVYKTDPARNLCFRLWMEPAGGGGLAIQVTAPWVVTHAEVTDHASDCALDTGRYPVQPVGSAERAISGTGTMNIQGSFPCEVTIHATVSFDAQAGWVPVTEPFDADAISVDGGCG